MNYLDNLEPNDRDQSCLCLEMARLDLHVVMDARMPGHYSRKYMHHRYARMKAKQMWRERPVKILTLPSLQFLALDHNNVANVPSIFKAGFHLQFF